MGIFEKRVTAAIAVTVALLSATACAEDKGTAENEPLTKTQIAQAALNEGDVPGYTIRDNSGVQSDPSARAAKKSCQPIVAMMAPVASADDERLALRSIVKTPTGSESPEASYQLVLSTAGSESAAEQAVQDLRGAVSSCGSGFEVTLSGEDYKIRQVAVNKSELGEKAVDFSLEYQMGRKMRYVMVQNGASLTKISASGQFESKFIAVPQKIIDAQQRKLDEAAK
ncbi:hypothetical protein ACQEVY_27560 [Streptomyces sp. CA-288835]|uniref:hypothetical protein n=1 Tax=Streptomyces sp. CA-288835 TaxID=3240069 RepID=UPI003D9040E2